ncbi:jg22973 [Pararge aegeria aegeria]|uniref:Jg22973 protein n=1 Tax=Pararge aegeria aegeria TaxID=348720 RepID=A0A8S4QSD1_9NEOP|nr:jg22973 [Pararge aegeria aegeria]
MLERGDPCKRPTSSPAVDVRRLTLVLPLNQLSRRILLTFVMRATSTLSSIANNICVTAAMTAGGIALRTSRVVRASSRGQTRIYDQRTVTHARARPAPEALPAGWAGLRAREPTCALLRALRIVTLNLSGNCAPSIVSEVQV